MAAKIKLSEIVANLDPLKLLEEMRALQAYLAALADGEAPPSTTSEPPNLATFVASLSSAWHAGEIRPTFSIEAKPRYLRSLQKVSTQTPVASPTAVLKPATFCAPAATSAKTREKPKPVYAEPGQAPRPGSPHGGGRSCALTPIEEEFPTSTSHAALPERAVRPVSGAIYAQAVQNARPTESSLWRQAARARGAVIGPKTYRRLSDKPRGRRPDIFKDHWEEMAHGAAA